MMNVFAVTSGKLVRLQIQNQRPGGPHDCPDIMVASAMLSVERAERLIADLQKAVDALPRERIGTPADLGCAVL
jgi:hypothetical protein